MTAAVMKADTRREVSAWSLCKWAYGQEAVRHVMGRDADWKVGGPGIVPTALVMRSLQLGASISGGGGGGAPTAPDDAIALHLGLMDSVPNADAWLVIRSAERGEVPVWSPQLPDLVVEPTMDETWARPRPKVYYLDRARTKPWLCPITYRGMTHAEKAEARTKARHEYAVFARTLGVILTGAACGALELADFSVTKIGVKTTPWEKVEKSL